MKTSLCAGASTGSSVLLLPRRRDRRAASYDTRTAQWARQASTPRDAEARISISRCTSVGWQIDVLEWKRTRDPVKVLIAGDEREAT